MRIYGSQRPSMFTNATVAPRGQVTARNNVGPRLNPRALSRPVISFDLEHGDGSQRPSLVHWARRHLRTRGTIGKVRGRSPEDPVGLRPVPMALSRPVISFELPTRRWLAEAINGLVGQEALVDKGDCRKRSPDHPVGPRPVPCRQVPWALS